ncbi:hypothetical protein LCGC14_0388670 [marine sediment metagenome]|uniref:Uncharacterized protein n=1 Tax=marine sediment metagenome TaxID=412755 RepID=A0A0F9T0C7_9ZZZZ
MKVSIKIKLHFLEWFIVPEVEHNTLDSHRSLSLQDNITWSDEPRRWYYTNLEFLFFTIYVANNHPDYRHPFQ